MDRTRRFVLPGIQELNKSQDEALALPMEGQHLIIGGPGTGKSVVALIRAKQLARAQKTYRTLVYNHVLDQSNQHLFGQEEPLSSKTWESWVRGILMHYFKDVPTLPPAPSSNFRAIDWEAAKQWARELKDVDDHSQRFLVIDEGQDMPVAFYEFLVALGFENFYVTADQNQQLAPERCSSRQDIENALGIEPYETLELKMNYRNSHSVARLAQHFYPDDPASPRPDLPVETVSRGIPELWHYGDSDKPSLAELAERVLQLSDRFPRKLIAVITPNNRCREKFVAALEDANPVLDHGVPPIQTFHSGAKASLDFGTGGVIVINAQSCKGLEFETVILADIDLHEPTQDTYALMSRFYVMVARAREQVIFLRTGEPCTVVESLLPTDPAILARV